MVLKINNSSLKEKICDKFTSALLIPEEAMINEFGSQRNNINFFELKTFKNEYKVSYRAILHRLKDLNIINEYLYKKLCTCLSQKVGKIDKELIKPEKTYNYKIIITDTNIITDLDNAKILNEFVKLENVYISDLVKNDEINSKTGNVNIINKFKIIETSHEELIEATILSHKENKLSFYDLLNFIIDRNNNGILVTRDNRFKEYSIKNNVEVTRTLRIIRLMYENKIISRDKALNAYTLLIDNNNTRIPVNLINEEIKIIKEDSL